MNLNIGNDVIYLYFIHKDPYGLRGILVAIFWFVCILLTILACCVIAGVLNKSQILLYFFNIGSILIFLANLLIIYCNTQFYLFEIF